MKSEINKELFLAGKRIMKKKTFSSHIGWYSLSAFIDWLEDNYNIQKKGGIECQK